MTDCNKFLKCERIENTDTYTETVETCPGGTLFDPNLSLCNWPQNVICQTYTYTTAPATTTTKNKINGNLIKLKIFLLKIIYKKVVMVLSNTQLIRQIVQK